MLFRSSNTQVNVFHTGFKACDDYRGAEAAMPQVACPTLFVLGSADQMTPPKVTREIATALKARVVTLDSGHHLMAEAPDGTLVDPFRAGDGEDVGALAEAHQARLLADPNFHAQNTYAIVMRILARFEFALGRRVEWGFNGHQLNVAPHAFLDANAFYSNEDSGLMFGYFKGKSGAMVFTSLSHDIVAHETTHALLDGLRDRFTEPSSPDQAAFHEAFADIVALLSVLAVPVSTEVLIPSPSSSVSASSNAPSLSSFGTRSRTMAISDMPIGPMRRPLRNCRTTGSSLVSSTSRGPNMTS